ncbi:hypothetical protein [Cellulomonas sp. PhB150]|uniref:hypothetical protein n=1 Tax=Cellulomonas sp. PhB150 TaxID=2485188 RepID=UPI000F4A33F5|nr:hypothetical protein [Cellulomonas sp. PhB150]ROS25928.1 hypothetical protein EDF34_2253 [Cellulomonas sp. PhB150]
MVARRNSILAFVGWALAGAVGALGLLTLVLPGLVAAVIVGTVALVLFFRLKEPYAASGVVAGGALPLFYVAWLNRQGPGEYCHALGGGGQECTDMWSPWPWAALGVLLVGSAVTLYVVARTRGWGAQAISR